MKAKFKIDELIFTAVFLLLPLIFNPFSGEVEKPKLILMTALALFLFLYKQELDTKNRAIKYALITLIIFGGISTLLAENSYLAFFGSWDRAFGFSAILACILIALALPKFKVEKISRLFILSGALTSFAAILMSAYVPDSLFEGRTGGTTGNPNILGAFLVPTIFLTLPRLNRKEKFPWIALVLQISALFQSGNRMSWLVLALITLIYFYREKRFIALSAGLLTASAFAFFGIDRIMRMDSIYTRLELYRLALKETFSHPLGIGFEHTQNVISSPDFVLLPDRAHQPFLDMALAAGIPSALALLALSVATFIALRKKNRALAFAFLGLFLALQSNFFTILTAFQFFVFLGLAL